MHMSVTRVVCEVGWFSERNFKFIDVEVCNNLRYHKNPNNRETYIIVLEKPYYLASLRKYYFYHPTSLNKMGVLLMMFPKISPREVKYMRYMFINETSPCHVTQEG